MITELLCGLMWIQVLPGSFHEVLQCLSEMCFDLISVSMLILVEQKALICPLIGRNSEGVQRKDDKSRVSWEETLAHVQDDE